MNENDPEEELPLIPQRIEELNPSRSSSQNTAQRSPEEGGTDRKADWWRWVSFIVVLVGAIGLLSLPTPLSPYLYVFESKALPVLSKSFLVITGIISIAIVLFSLAFYLLRWLKFRGVQGGDEPPKWFERILIGPLTLFALMLGTGVLTTEFILRTTEGPSVVAGATVAALLSSFPLTFLLAGLVIFSLANTRRLYKTMLIVAAASIIALPVLGNASGPIGDWLLNRQYKSDQGKVEATQSMADCAKLHAGLAWTNCISAHTESVDDYNECLKQAPSKDLPGDKGRAVSLCDREVELYLELASGRYVMVGSNFGQLDKADWRPATDNLAIGDCQSFTRYRAWSVCVKVTLNTSADYSTCLQQGRGRQSEFGEGGVQYCTSIYANAFDDYGTCSQQLPASSQQSCIPLIMRGLTAQSDVSWCYQLSTRVATEFSDSDASECILKLLELNANDHQRTVSVCGYVAGHSTVAFRKGNSCSQSIVEEYIGTLTTVDQCAPFADDTGSTGLLYWRDCVKKTIHSSADYQACVGIAQKQGTNQATVQSYCAQAWPG